MNYVADGQIVLNVASSAVGTIALGDNTIEFSARFAGKLEHITIPYGAIGAIYAKENGAGTSLPIEHPNVEEDDIEEIVEKPKSSLSSVATTGSEKDKSQSKTKTKPTLKIIK
jgi:stringent starvation protein B